MFCQFSNYPQHPADGGRNETFGKKTRRCTASLNLMSRVITVGLLTALRLLFQVEVVAGLKSAPQVQPQAGSHSTNRRGCDGSSQTILKAILKDVLKCHT